MRSLQHQLQRNMLLTLAIVLATLLVLVNLGVKQLTQNYIASRLQHDADGIIAALKQSDQDKWQVDYSHLPAIYSRVHSGHYFRVQGDQIDIRSRSLWDHVPTIDLLAPGKSQVGYITGQEQELWLTWTQGIRKGDTSLTVWVAEDVSEFHITRHRYAFWVGTILVVCVILLMLIQHWILKNGFRQLESVRANIQAIHSGQFSNFDRQLPLEVQPLVLEIERLLERLQQRVSRSRNALGNLAHEMKRPLQQFRLLADSLPADQRQAWLQTLDNITHLVERELKRARIVGVSSPGRQTRLTDELPPLITLLAKIHPHCTLQTDYQTDLVLPQDRDDMLELLGNLLDNACKYGAGQVKLVIQQHSDGWQIRVQDNGHGIAENALASISQRGVRLDESQSGTGLGLAICKDIVDSYQGTLLFENLPEQSGFCVTVTLPRQPL